EFPSNSLLCRIPSFRSWCGSWLPLLSSLFWTDRVHRRARFARRTSRSRPHEIGSVMNLNEISTQLLFTTVPIWVQKAQGIATGTGFIYNVILSDNPARSIPLLITNFHVVEDALDGV